MLGTNELVIKCAKAIYMCRKQNIYSYFYNQQTLRELNNLIALISLQSK